MNTTSDVRPVCPVNRRQAIGRVSALLGAMLGGAAFAGGRGLLAACERAGERPDAPPPGEFTAADIALLDEIAETILPATKTPGAKAAKTGAFMALMVTDCYRPAERKRFREGMLKVDEAARRAAQVPFMQATPPQRTAVLAALDREQKHVMDAREVAQRSRAGMSSAPATALDEHSEPPHYFRMMKELALLGYFTSEIGCTQALRYVESPGRFDPCVPYTPGEPAWAAHA